MTSPTLAPGMRVTISVPLDCPRGGHTANGMGTVFPTDELDREAGEWAVLPDLRDGHRTTCLMLFAEDELTPHPVSLVKSHPVHTQHRLNVAVFGDRDYRAWVAESFPIVQLRELPWSSAPLFDHMHTRTP